MTKLKIFPKTFIISITMLLSLIMMIHMAVYFLLPQIYRHQKSKKTDAYLEKLVLQVEGQPLDKVLKITDRFAERTGVNINIKVKDAYYYFKEFENEKARIRGMENKNQEKYLRGKKIPQSIDRSDDMTIDAGKALKGEDSLILRKATFKEATGGTVIMSMFVDARPIQEAKDATLQLLPYTLMLSVLFALVFSYFYSRKITRPIKEMVKGTAMMQNLVRGAHCNVNTADELGVLCRRINRLYEELSRTIDALEKENLYIAEVEKEKIIFLQAASHELKTPLTGLRIMMENMQLNIGEYSDRDKYLEEAVGQVDKLSGMVNQLLTSTKLSDNVRFKQEENLDLGETIYEILEEYELLIRRKNISLKTSVFSVETIGNKDFWRKVFTNIIDNAVRYTPDGGVISVEVTFGRISIRNQSDNVNRDELQKVFTPFYSQGARIYGYRDSSGLGMYLVKSLLDSKNIPFSFLPTEDGVEFQIDIDSETETKAEDIEK